MTAVVTSEQAPDVSVVISVKNRSGMLLDCMRGLAAQRFGRERFEVVVIDNCSSEDLAPVIVQARAMGLDVRMTRTERDGGPAPARNLGVSLARGRIIAFTDSDCRPTANWLDTVVPHFDDDRVALVAGPVLGKPEQRVTFTTRLTFITETEHPSFPTANLCMRRDVFLAHGGFDASLSFTDFFDRATECADTDLAWRIIKSGYERRFDPRAVMHHELEQLTLLLWIMEASRLFVLPELVRRHPNLRDTLLKYRILFYPPAAALYVAIPFAAVTAWLEPLLLLLLPMGLLARGVQRTHSLNPVSLLRFCGRTLVHLPRMLILNAALLYGSIRFRCVVL